MVASWKLNFLEIHREFVFLFQVKVLFVRNLANTVTEEILEKAFSQFGKLERVKKLKDYAFIHFDERDGAVKVNKWWNYHRHLSRLTTFSCNRISMF